MLGRSALLGATNSVPPLWTPQNISGWVQLFIADSVNVQLDGSSGVSQLNDLSGNGYHATQATAADRPIWSATSFGGAPGITGGGTATQLLEHAAPDPSDIYSAFVTVTNITFQNTYQVIYSSKVDAKYRLVWYLRFGSTIMQIPSYQYQSGTNPTLLSNTAYTLSFTNNNSISYNCRTNASAQTIQIASTYYAVNAGKYIFNDIKGTPDNCPATLGACGYINRVLTTDELERIEGWAAWKHGYTANLPSGHTYKSAAPTI